MLYLEDFIELNESLPDEIRARLTELRVIDLEVQNDLDQLNASVDEYFEKAPLETDYERDQAHEKLQAEYRRIGLRSDQKVKIASNLSDLMEKYQRKLHEQLTKFKLELEADNPGLSEQLEQRVRKAEIETRDARRAARRKQLAKIQRQSLVNESDQMPSNTRQFFPDDDFRLPGTSQKRSSISRQERASNDADKNATLVEILRNASGPLKEERERKLAEMAASNNLTTAELDKHLMPPPQSIAAPAGLGSIVATPESRHGRHRKPSTRVQELLEASMLKKLSQPAPSPIAGPGASRHLSLSGATGSSSHASFTMGSRSLSDSTVGMEEESEEEEGDDDTQRKWCFCNEKSYGGMVACDSQTCPYEWFHYECVKIKEPPRGKWYCPHCIKYQRQKSVDDIMDTS